MIRLLHIFAAALCTAALASVSIYLGIVFYAIPELRKGDPR